MTVSKSTLFLLAGAFALVVGVMCMPRTPASAPNPPVSQGVPIEEIGTNPVDIAVAKVSGENPMEGILELRALADAEYQIFKMSHSMSEVLAYEAAMNAKTNTKLAK